jgi:ubiquinone/menaquinone biosynthesis C-methylase UbiE
LAIPLAKLFEKVLAVDPDDGMLAVGRQKAKSQRISNITWQKGSSKELIYPHGFFRLVTMGQSFHWMDQEKVLSELYDLIGTAGGLAIVGTEPVAQTALSQKKDKIVKKLIGKYLGPKRRAGSGFYTPPPKKYKDLNTSSKFQNFEERQYDVKIRRNIDQILGNLFSMSWALKIHFAEQLVNFEDDLRQQLEALSPGGEFEEKVRFSLYTMTK